MMYLEDLAPDLLAIAKATHSEAVATIEACEEIHNCGDLFDDLRGQLGRLHAIITQIEKGNRA